jgi:hypothetical protein
MSLLNICVVSLASFLLIGAGLYGLKRGFSLFATKHQFWKDFVAWRVFGDAYPFPQTITDVERSWCYLYAMVALGGGVGLILMEISIVVISLLTTGTVGGVDLGDGFFFTATSYSSLFVGVGAGGIFAVWRMRTVAKRSITYADLRQRRLSDYRSDLLRWLPLVVIAQTVALSWFFAPHLGATLRLLPSAGAVALPKSLWMLSVVPGAMLVVFLVAEVIMSRLARLSRLLITSDPTVSRQADDMLRAIVIGIVQGYELAAVAYLGLSQNGLLVQSLWASGYWRMGNLPYHEITDVSFLLLKFIQVFGLCLWVARGHLGGRLSGWPFYWPPAWPFGWPRSRNHGKQPGGG